MLLRQGYCSVSRDKCGNNLDDLLGKSSYLHCVSIPSPQALRLHKQFGLKRLNFAKVNLAMELFSKIIAKSAKKANKKDLVH